MSRRGRISINRVPGVPGATITIDREPRAADLEAMRAIGREMAARELDEPRRAPIPAQVELRIPPLEGLVLDRHAEQAAALLVRAAQRAGEWLPVSAEDLDAMLEAECRAGLWPIATLMRQRSFSPNFHALVDRGFARFLSSDPSVPWPVEFTPAGLQALWQFVRGRG